MLVHDFVTFSKSTMCQCLGLEAVYYDYHATSVVCGDWYVRWTSCDSLLKLDLTGICGVDLKVASDAETYLKEARSRRQRESHPPSGGRTEEESGI
jgi:hypothetical protein